MILSSGLRIELMCPVPSLWRRLLDRLFNGITWKEIE